MLTAVKVVEKKILETSLQMSNIQKSKSLTQTQKTLLIPENETTELIFKNEFIGLLELVLVKT